MVVWVLSMGNYFFHIGSEKTGTTIIARLIDQHPKIACMNEAFFLLHGHKASIFNPQIKTPRHGYTLEQRAIWSTYIRGTRDYKIPIVDALEDFRKRCKAETVGDSWVRYISHIDEMVEMFPDAKYLYNVRDPRAVWLSGETFKNKHLGDNILRAMLMRDKIIQNYKDKLNILTFKYEDVITNPVGLMTAICKFLGHDYCPNYLEYSKEDDPYPLRWGQVTHKEIEPYHIDKWKKLVKVKKIREINKLSKDFMERYGYCKTSLS